MPKTKAGSKPAKTTRPKAVDKTKAVKPAAKQPKKAAAPSRAKKPAPARKPLPKVKVPAKRQTKTPLSKQPSAASSRVYPNSLCGVSTPAQASALYGGLEKNEARRIRRQFYAAGRRDLAAALRILPS